MCLHTGPKRLIVLYILHVDGVRRNDVDGKGIDGIVVVLIAQPYSKKVQISRENMLIISNSYMMVAVMG